MGLGFRVASYTFKVVWLLLNYRHSMLQVIRAEPGYKG